MNILRISTLYILGFSLLLNATVQSQTSDSAPLPNFGAQAYYKIKEWFGVSGLFSLFFLSIDDYAGSIHTFGGQMDFYLMPWLDAGLGYYLFDINLEVSKTQFTGLFDYLYKGPYLSLGFRF